MDKIKKMNKSRDMRKSRRKSRKSRSSGKCSMYLNRKIGINISEFKAGRYKSQPQAVAVAYSQVRKEHPACKRMFPKIRKSPKNKKIIGGATTKDDVANIFKKIYPEYGHIPNKNLEEKLSFSLSVFYTNYKRSLLKSDKRITRNSRPSMY